MTTASTAPANTIWGDDARTQEDPAQREADYVAAFCVSGNGHLWDDPLDEYEPATPDCPGIPGDAWACTACGHELYREHATGAVYLDGVRVRNEESA